ncbi:hypothetical protein DFH09DRAFT_1076448 [Mycena vulgaris]|nr:hypothetical protein DFH09DRAFT_1076448 [Mycena vulgaris]
MAHRYSLPDPMPAENELALQFLRTIGMIYTESQTPHQKASLIAATPGAPRVSALTYVGARTSPPHPGDWQFCGPAARQNPPLPSASGVRHHANPHHTHWRVHGSTIKYDYYVQNTVDCFFNMLKEAAEDSRGFKWMLQMFKADWLTSIVWLGTRDRLTEDAGALLRLYFPMALVHYSVVVQVEAAVAAVKGFPKTPGPSVVYDDWRLFWEIAHECIRTKNVYDSPDSVSFCGFISSKAPFVAARSVRNGCTVPANAKQQIGSRTAPATCATPCETCTPAHATAASSSASSTATTSRSAGTSVPNRSLSCAPTRARNSTPHSTMTLSQLARACAAERRANGAACRAHNQRACASHPHRAAAVEQRRGLRWFAADRKRTACGFGFGSGFNSGGIEPDPGAPLPRDGGCLNDAFVAEALLTHLCSSLSPRRLCGWLMSDMCITWETTLVKVGYDREVALASTLALLAYKEPGLTHNSLMYLGHADSIPRGVSTASSLRVHETLPIRGAATTARQSSIQLETKGDKEESHFLDRRPLACLAAEYCVYFNQAV